MKSKSVPVTVVIPTRNEARNLPDCLASVEPAQAVVVVDSNSTDDTPAIARAAGAQLVPFKIAPAGPKKRQWALQTIVFTTPWVLLVDADERIPPALWNEIAEAIRDAQGASAFLITKGFNFLGRRFRFGGFSHQAVLLVQPTKVRFEQLIAHAEGEPDMEIHERLHVDGRIGSLATPLTHQAATDDLTPYIARHEYYAKWEARLRHRYQLTGRWGEDGIQARALGDAQERRRWLKLLSLKVPLEPLWWFCYHYLAKLGCLEGKPGLTASLVRMRYIKDIRTRTARLHRESRQPTDSS